MKTQPLVGLQNVQKSYAGVVALAGIDFCIYPGEIHGLVGENGSGKSTLIKIIAGALRPDGGVIQIGEREFHHISPISAIRQGIQVIFQDFSLFPNLSVAENIALNSELARQQLLVNWRRVRRVAREAIGKLEVSLNLDERVENISVSEKQLVAICRALVQDAKLIIMDEPTTALTQKEVGSLFGVIRSLKQRGVAILFVSHKLEEVCAISDRISVLRNGKRVAGEKVAKPPPATLASLMTGRELEPRRMDHAGSPADGSDCLLEVNGLSRTGSYSVVSFKLRHGEILGITGLLGSGQTELAHGLFGLLPFDEGQARIDGRAVRLGNIGEAMACGIGYVPEDRLTQGLFLEHSIANNLVSAFPEQVSDRLGFLSAKRIDDEVQKWISLLSIVTPSARFPVKTLSGGNQQRVVIGRWLSRSPRILILNNPTAGVDIGSKYQIHELIRSLARRGMGILLISDDIPELMENCKRILLMRKGRVVEELLANELEDDELFRKIGG